jgi:hypothetical protein
MGVRPRGEGDVYEESGAYAELLRVINQTAGGGPITQQQRDQIRTEVENTRNLLRQQLDAERGAATTRLKNLNLPDSYIESVLRGSSGGTSPGGARLRFNPVTQQLEER